MTAEATLSVGRQVCTTAICLVDTWQATPSIYRPLLSIDPFSVKVVDTWQAMQGYAGRI